MIRDIFLVASGAVLMLYCLSGIVAISTWRDIKHLSLWSMVGELIISPLYLYALIRRFDSGQNQS